MTPYQSRVIRQLENWVGGLSQHNNIDDECCPDFSCCMPSLFTKDREERMAIMNSTRKNYGLPIKVDG